MFIFFFLGQKRANIKPYSCEKIKWLFSFFCSCVNNTPCLSEIGGVTDEILHDILAAFRGVAAHVELDRLIRFCIIRTGDRRQTHVRTDEFLELLGVQFPQALEARDLTVLTALLDGFLALFVREAVVLLLSFAFGLRTRKSGVSRMNTRLSSISCL